MIVPVRALTSLFLSIEYLTVPVPVPGLPEVTASHAELLVADHGQCAGAVTVRIPAAASLLNDALLGEISSMQVPRPSCTTDTVWPATVSMPARAVSDEFAVRVTLTTPFPVPFAPLVIEIQPRSDVAAHVQWLAVVTVSEPGPPEAPTDSDVAERVRQCGFQPRPMWSRMRCA